MELLKNYYTISSKINIDVKELIKSGNYESIIVKLMNQSSLVFQGTYSHLSTQSNGECDFIDITTKEKFDAKIPLNVKQGKMIGSRNGDVRFLSTELYSEAVAYGKCFNQTPYKDISEIELYKVMKHCLEKTKADENVIFFIPYPIVLDFDGFPLAGATDLLKNFYREFSKTLDIKNKQLFAIYISFDKKIVLRNLGTDCREYLSCPEMDHYVSYDISTIG